MSELQFKKIKGTSISSEVYENVRHSIIHGSLLPGTHLSEERISTQMDVSRSPIREAFRRLEADGLIELRANRGAFVKEFTVDEISEIYTARSLIEGYMAELAAERASSADVKRLRQAVMASLEPAYDGDYKATIDADFDLHRLIWKISGHKTLYDVIARLEVQIRMFIAAQAPLFDNLIESVKDHQEIIENIAKGDSEAARDSIQQHILEAGDLIVSRLSQEKDAKNKDGQL